MVADDGNQIVKNDDLLHAWKFPGCVVVDPGDLAAEYRARHECREFHAGKHRVDAVDSLAVGLVRRVEAF